MAEAKIPDNDEARLTALHGYELLDQEADPVFESVIRIAADVCEVDISVIALIGRERQYFFARNGMKPRETPRAIAFCAHAILEPYETFEIPDATKDPRFADNPLVTGDIGVRFYAAQPLTTPDGLAIGGLCLIGKTPKTMNEVQRNTLKRLAEVLMSMFESRKTALAKERRMSEAKDAALAALRKLQQRDSELDVQNEHFQAALENMTQGLCMYDAEQRLIVCNSRYAAMHGLPPELTKTGTSIKQIIRHRHEMGTYTRESALAYARERFEWCRNPWQENRVYEFNDGRIISVVRMPLAGGGWVTTHDDITELKRTQMDLEESNNRLLQEKKRFRDLYRQTPAMMHSIDRNGVIVDISDHWLEVMGYEAREVIGRESADFLTVESRRFAVEEVLPEFWRQGSCSNVPYQFVKKDGSIIDVKLSAIINNQDGDNRSFAVLVDVTDQVRAERELIDHRDHLQELVTEATADLKAKARELEAALAREKELNELQRQFVSMASHEFRTPLAIIDSTAQRLKRSATRLTSDEALKRIEKIRGAVGRMTRLMESTLTAARLEDGNIAVQLEACDVGQVISEVCSRLQEISRGHVITCEMTALPRSIRADSSALDQVLTNLLTNAIKYSPAAMDIRVRAYGEDGNVVISVSDRGIGIDEEDLPLMFGRFFRARTATGIDGTGIGLNLVKKLVELHGGRVDVESARGQGSTFTVRLPVGGPASAERAA